MVGMLFSYENQKKIQATFLGVGLSGATVVVGMPLDNIKTKIQTTHPNSNYRQISSLIYKNAGAKGFYTGLLPAGLQRAFKAAFRTPLMFMTDSVTNSLLAEGTNVQRNLVNGLCMGFFDTFITNPTDAAKVYLMTRPPKTQNPITNPKNLLAWRLLPEGMKPTDLFRGFGFTYSRTTISWIVFYYAGDFTKQITGESKLSLSSMVVASTAATIIKVLLTTPFDVIKSRLQQAQRTEQNANAKAVIVDIFHGGYTKFFSGMTPRLFHAFMSFLIGNIVREYAKEPATPQPQISHTSTPG